LADCKECGARLAPGARYCSRCGRSVLPVRVEEFTINSDKLVEKVRELLHEGNVTRVIVKDEKGNTLVDMPATVGLVGVLLAPLLAAVGAVAAIATKCTLTIVRKEE
jgi:hypothetical protein